MRKHSKMYVFWVEFGLNDDEELCKRPITFNKSLQCFICGWPFASARSSSSTLGVWFEPDNFQHKGVKTPLVKKEFAFRKSETIDQYINSWLEWERKHIQKSFDKQSARAPAEYRMKYKVRYGRANSKECPFYVPQYVIKRFYESTSIFRSAMLKSLTIYQKENR